MSRSNRPNSLDTIRIHRGYASPDNPACSKYSKDIKFLQFLMMEYGTSEFVIDITDSLLTFAQKFFKGKKKYQTAITLLKYGIPAAVLTGQLIDKFRKYQKIKSGKDDAYNDKTEKFRQLMGVTDKNSNNLHSIDFPLGREVFNWLFQRNKTEKFKIKGFYSSDNLKPIEDVYATDPGSIFIPIEFEKSVFIIEVTLNFSVMMDDCLIRAPYAHFICELEVATRLKATIFQEFLAHYDTTANVVYLHSNEMRTFPRQVIKEEILQFDIGQLSKEIRKVLKKGKKRGWAFVGVPGTGKSTIIRKLESEITEYPIVYATQSNFMSEYDIAETFMTISYLQPCIMIMEDLDSFDLKDKKRNLGVFLDCIDDINGRLNVVILATINDTSLVHYSLINRPGRLDQVIMVKSPQRTADIYRVMDTRYKKNAGIEGSNLKKDFIPMSEVDGPLLAEILSKGYTQADICEIIEKAILLSDEMSNEVLYRSLKELEESKRAIQKCNFRGQNPAMIIEDGPEAVDIGLDSRAIPLIR